MRCILGSNLRQIAKMCSFSPKSSKNLKIESTKRVVPNIKVYFG